MEYFVVLCDCIRSCFLAEARKKKKKTIFSQDTCYHRAVGTPHLHEGVSLFRSIIHTTETLSGVVVHCSCRLQIIHASSGSRCYCELEKTGKNTWIVYRTHSPYNTSPFKDDSLSIWHTLPDNYRTTVG